MKITLKEFFLHEYEDPTSSKDPSGDSKWSSPLSHGSGVPEEAPAIQSQERSSDDWGEMRDDGPEEQSAGELEGFFGEEPFPQSERKVSEAQGDQGSKKGGIDPDAPLDELPDELPDEWLVDLTGKPAAPKQGGAPAQPGEEPAQGGEAGDVDWDAMSDEDFIDQLAAGNIPDIKPSAAPAPEPEDPPAPEEPEEPAEPPRPPHGMKEPSEEDMTWDEFRAVEPDAAQELERDMPDENERTMGHFQRKQDGRVYFHSATGQRMSWLGEPAGWVDMDDGETPAGEF